MLVAVVLVTREIPEVWNIEPTQFHGPKVVSCEIVTGIQQTTLIRAYLTPANMDHLQDLNEALTCLLGKYTIVMGNLNADVKQMG